MRAALRTWSLMTRDLRANSQSLQLVYANYPYSPRWPAKEIAARIKYALQHTHRTHTQRTRTHP
jgi:hypothetical protein